MTETVLQKRLKVIVDRILTETDYKEVGQMVKNRLLPFILENEELRVPYEEQSDCYPRLAKNPEYNAQIEKIHVGLEELYKHIDPKKLPRGSGHMRMNYFEKEDEVKDKPWLELEEIHALLVQREKWRKLGGRHPYTGGDSSRAPWQPVYNQYTLIRPLVSEAEVSGAIDDPEQVIPFAFELFAEIENLEKMLVQAKYKLETDAFESFDVYARNPEWFCDDERKAENVKRTVKIVCTELLLILEERTPAPKEQRGKQREMHRKIRSIVNGIVTTVNGDEHPFKKKNSSSALLSEKVFAYCRQVGDSVENGKVFPEVWRGSYNSDPLVNCKTVNDAVGNANKWAKKQGLPALMKASKTHIERLA